MSTLSPPVVNKPGEGRGGAGRVSGVFTVRPMMGLNEDLKLVGSQFSNIATFLFVGLGP